MVQQVAGGNARPPSELVPGFDAGLEEIIMKALAREPDMRYQTAAEFEAALRGFVRHRIETKKK